MAEVAGNVLFYGDNLDVLRRHVPDESVDLVYLDPPFNSNASYSVLFGHADGSQSAAQIKAFEDTWHWDQAAAAAFQETVTRGGSVAAALAAFQTLLGSSTMLAYLAMMAPRLVELRQVLKPTGSLYLHCDPTASHYLKLLLDSVFGATNFRNEVTWKRTSSHSDAGRYGRIHDVLLFYSKSKTFIWNPQPTKVTADDFRGHDIMREPNGRPYRLADATAAHGGETLLYEWKGRLPGRGRFWAYARDSMEKLEADGQLVYNSKGSPRIKRYLDELPGVQLQDLWTDIGAINSAAKERLGYPTQKPQALLERIINVSSNPDGIVLDPFCGCGTSISAAQKLGRKWVGIDITYLAISLIKSRLTAVGSSDYAVLGEPTTTDDAEQLAVDDPYQFQWWALGLIGARPAEGKKGADKGIDGRLFFFDESGLKPKQAIVSVKAGKLHATYVRDLVDGSRPSSYPDQGLS